MDGSILELFLGERLTLTSRIYPTSESLVTRARSSGAATRHSTTGYHVATLDRNHCRRDLMLRLRTCE